MTDTNNYTSNLGQGRDPAPRLEPHSVSEAHPRSERPDEPHAHEHVERVTASANIGCSSRVVLDADSSQNPETSEITEGDPDNITAELSIPYILDAPCSFLLDPSGLFNSRFIKNPHYLQPFTRVGHPVFATGAVKKNYTEWDEYFYADCYLTPDESAHEPSWTVHPIALHPCAFQSGEKFILLQIQERVSDTSATWEQSLAEALSAPIGQWLRIRANREQQRVEFELMSPQMAKTPEYPEFLAEVLSLAVSVQIPNLEHQIRSLIRESHRDPSRIAPTANGQC